MNARDILRAEWRPCDLPPGPLSELLTWTIPADPGRRVLVALEGAGGTFVRVERPDGSVEQAWRVVA
jgi:hypothetical protein